MKTFAIFACVACAAAQAQQPAVFKSESKVVLIDTVVTGRKGEYVRDLTAKDFRVWEDNKEQTITSFALQNDSSNAEPSRLVLFFDDAGMSPADQAGMRQAAARFIDADVSSSRWMAVVTFDGGYRVGQSFTDNAGRLKDARRGVRLAGSNSNAPVRFSGPRGYQPQGINPGSVDAGGLIQSVGYLAQNLNAVPGRKIVVLFGGAAGFSSLQSGDAAGLAQICNRSNVAVYPVLATAMQEASGSPTGPVGLVRPGVPGPNSPDIPDVQPDANIPFMIAKETGGFVVPAANDLPGQLQKIGAEQNQYYVLGYTPPDFKEGTCHTLRVKLDRSHTAVRSRSSYCTAKPQDLLAESRIEQDLEKRAAAPQAGGKTGAGVAEIQAPFFYLASNVALVHVAMEIPTEALKFETQKGRLHAEINILGFASAPDGGVKARFSDIVERDFDSEQDAGRFKERPLHYEKEFKIVPGRYNLTVVFGSGGESFGRVERPLEIDAYDAGQFAVSGLALSKQARPASELGLETSLIDEETPLIAGGMQLIPSGSSVFSRTEQAWRYFETYAPATSGSATTIGLRILEAKSGAQKWDGGSAKLESPAGGKSTIPAGLSIPIASLSPGSYQLEVTAKNGVDQSIRRTIDFEIK